MNKLDAKDRAKILHLLCEGNSIRAVTRLTGASKNTVTKLMIDAGRACDDYHHWTVHGLQSKRVQVDEIWSFVYSKQANAPKTKVQVEGRGDCWTWTAIDADSKFLISYYVGTRDSYSAHLFMGDLHSRLANRIQLTSDGHGAYYKAVADIFGPGQVDFAQLVKLYGAPKEGSPAERRYSPAICTGAKPTPVFGAPEREHISTSYAERQNLNLRMHNRRFTRLTNAFSKKLENHMWAIALFTFYYNFVRLHQTLRTTPAMAAGVSERLWEMSDMVKLLEAFEEKQLESKKLRALTPVGRW